MAARSAFGGLFVDENMLRVAYELERLHPNEVYYVGHPLVPEIPSGTKDSPLFDALGLDRNSWIFVSRDRRIWRNKIARKHWIDARVRAVVLSGSNSISTDSALELIHSHWLTIVEEVGSKQGPGFWSLTKPNGLRRIDA